jgi:hypothetical protein
MHDYDDEENDDDVLEGWRWEDCIVTAKCHDKPFKKLACTQLQALCEPDKQ